MTVFRRAVFASLACVLAACGSGDTAQTLDGGPFSDGGALDATSRDANVIGDASARDASPTDAALVVDANADAPAPQNDASADMAAPDAEVAADADVVVEDAHVEVDASVVVEDAHVEVDADVMLDADVVESDAEVIEADAFVAPDLCTERVWYRDADEDGFGDGATSVMSCSQPDGFADNDDDCDDSNSAISPDASEVCNGTDDDCDESTDEGVTSSVEACGASCTACPSDNGDAECVDGACVIACNPGFREVLGECVDVDECAESTYACALSQTCANEYGSFRCDTAAEVRTGIGHTCALSRSGEVRCWGDGSSGQLGYGDTTARPSPGGAVSFGEGLRAADLDVGGRHACAILSDQSVVCWGDNSSGQLGDGTNVSRTAPVAVTLPEGRTAVMVSCGTGHSCAILDDGTMACWGANAKSQLGIGSNVAQTTPHALFLEEGVSATFVSAGDVHTCAVADDGRVFCWGDGGNGRLGDGTGATRNVPTPTGSLGEGRRARTVSAGVSHTCATLEDGGGKCWGNGSTYRLGRGSDSSSLSSPPSDDISSSWMFVEEIAAGKNHTCARYRYNAIRCWGDSEYGQLGVDTLTPDLSTFARDVSVDGSLPAAGLDGSYDHLCAISHAGNVKCWGRNEDGQLGYGDKAERFVTSPTPVDVGDGALVDAIGSTAHAYRTCFTMRDGALRCVGDNAYGVLGYGDTIRRFAPLANIHFGEAASYVVASSNNACGLGDSGSVRCWGLGSNGTNGMGSNTSTRAPDPAGAVDFGADRFATDLALGPYFACALLDDGSVRCWGNNYAFGYGYAVTTQTNAPGAAVDLGAGRTATQVTAGEGHVCARLDDGTAKCWGRNDYGQLGLGDTTSRATPAASAIAFGGERTVRVIRAGGVNTCAVLDDDSLRCWGAGSMHGYGDYTARAMPPATALGLPGPVVDVAVGSSNACALVGDGDVHCWGGNSHGGLGYGDTTARIVPSATPLDLGEGRVAVGISVGIAASCAVLDDGSAKCWGANDFGQLGIGGYYLAPSAARSALNVF